MNSRNSALITALSIFQYLLTAYAVCVLLVCFGFGVAIFYSWSVAGLAPVANVAFDNLGAGLLITLKIIGSATLLASVSSLLVYKVLPRIFDRVSLNDIRHWDEEHSVETCLSRNVDVVVKSAVVLCVVIAIVLLLPIFWLIFPQNIIFIAAGITLCIAVIAIFVLLRAAQANERSLSYYPRTKALYDLLLENFGGGWSAQSDGLLEKIPQDSTDFQVAHVMRARAKGEVAHASFEYDNVNLSDPEIHYGPRAAESLDRAFEAHKALMNSDMRIG